jgi:hypothetical protein
MKAIPELRFHGRIARWHFPRVSGRYNRYNTNPAMIPLIPENMLVTTVETVCYFCTAVGVLLTFMFSSRR